MVPQVDVAATGAKVAVFVMVAGLLGVAWLAVRTVLRWRGTRLVRCPETRATAAVKVDVKRALKGAALGHDELRLRDCSRWPERAGCGQDCLAQVERAPEDCRVRAIVGDWYRGQACVYCGFRFGDIHWHDHRPALRDAEGRTRQWSDVRPEELPHLFDTCRPVCWNCHVAESFRSQHPELVVDRQPRPEPEHEPRHPGGGRPVA